MNKNLMIGGLVAVLIIGAIIMLASRNNQNSQVTDTAPKNETVAPTVNPTTETTNSAEVAVREFTVRGSNFKFDISEIKVKKGDTVKITYVNSSGFHDLTIDEFNVKTKQSQSPTSETVTFVADKAGTFEYYCSVGKHRAQGMKGNLIVE